MTLIGQDVLQRAGRRNVSLRKWLSLWAVTVELRVWHDLQELRRDYPTADAVKLKSRLVVTVFNVKGNEYRLLIWVDYSAEIVEVLEVLTHAEYDKNAWKGRF